MSSFSENRQTYKRYFAEIKYCYLVFVITTVTGGSCVVHDMFSHVIFSSCQDNTVRTIFRTGVNSKFSISSMCV